MSETTARSLTTAAILEEGQARDDNASEEEEYDLSRRYVMPNLVERFARRYRVKNLNPALIAQTVGSSQTSTSTSSSTKLACAVGTTTGRLSPLRGASGYPMTSITPLGLKAQLQQSLVATNTVPALPNSSYLAHKTEARVQTTVNGITTSSVVFKSPPQIKSAATLHPGFVNPTILRTVIPIVSNHTSGKKSSANAKEGRSLMSGNRTTLATASNNKLSKNAAVSKQGSARSGASRSGTFRYGIRAKSGKSGGFADGMDMGTFVDTQEYIRMNLDPILDALTPHKRVVYAPLQRPVEPLSADNDNVQRAIKLKVSATADSFGQRAKLLRTKRRSAMPNTSAMYMLGRGGAKLGGTSIGSKLTGSSTLRSSVANSVATSQDIGDKSKDTKTTTVQEAPMPHKSNAKMAKRAKSMTKREEVALIKRKRFLKAIGIYIERTSKVWKKVEAARYLERNRIPKDLRRSHSAPTLLRSQKTIQSYPTKKKIASSFGSLTQEQLMKRLLAEEEKRAPTTVAFAKPTTPSLRLRPMSKRSKYLGILRRVFSAPPRQVTQNEVEARKEARQSDVTLNNIGRKKRQQQELTQQQIRNILACNPPQQQPSSQPLDHSANLALPSVNQRNNFTDTHRSGVARRLEHALLCPDEIPRASLKRLLHGRRHARRQSVENGTKLNLPSTDKLAKNTRSNVAVRNTASRGNELSKDERTIGATSTKPVMIPLRKVAVKERGVDAGSRITSTNSLNAASVTSSQSSSLDLNNGYVSSDATNPSSSVELPPISDGVNWVQYKPYDAAAYTTSNSKRRSFARPTLLPTIMDASPSQERREPLPSIGTGGGVLPPNGYNRAAMSSAMSRHSMNESLVTTASSSYTAISDASSRLTATPLGRFMIPESADDELPKTRKNRLPQPRNHVQRLRSLMHVPDKKRASSIIEDEFEEIQRFMAESEGDLWHSDDDLDAMGRKTSAGGPRIPSAAAALIATPPRDQRLDYRSYADEVIEELLGRELDGEEKLVNGDINTLDLDGRKSAQQYRPTTSERKFGYNVSPPTRRRHLALVQRVAEARSKTNTSWQVEEFQDICDRLEEKLLKEEAKKKGEHQDKEVEGKPAWKLASPQRTMLNTKRTLRRSRSALAGSNCNVALATDNTFSPIVALTGRSRSYTIDGSSYHNTLELRQLLDRAQSRMIDAERIAQRRSTYVYNTDFVQTKHRNAFL